MAHITHHVFEASSSCPMTTITSNFNPIAVTKSPLIRDRIEWGKYTNVYLVVVMLHYSAGVLQDLVFVNRSAGFDKGCFGALWWGDGRFDGLASALLWETLCIGVQCLMSDRFWYQASLVSSEDSLARTLLSLFIYGNKLLPAVVGNEVYTFAFSEFSRRLCQLASLTQVVVFRLVPFILEQRWVKTNHFFHFRFWKVESIFGTSRHHVYEWNCHNRRLKAPLYPGMNLRSKIASSWVISIDCRVKPESKSGRLGSIVVTSRSVQVIFVQCSVSSSVHMQFAFYNSAWVISIASQS